MNPDKTENGQLISSYACDPRTVDAEFLYSKKRYDYISGKVEINNVIAYQVRQSFKPQEVSPEEANQIGYDFASRFLKGKHAFIVCTHTDKKHIHNHIIWNSTTLDCKRKFRNFWGSSKAVARLSDLICTEHHLSVILNPKRKGKSYDKWLGNQAKPSHREILRQAIDLALSKKPHDFDSFLLLLSEEGFERKPGKYLTFTHKDFENAIRVGSLGSGYSEDELRAVIQGQRIHTPSRKKHFDRSGKAQDIIDIQAKLAEGKGEGYRRWATVENLKRMAKTKLYLDEHGLDYDTLAERKLELTKREQELSAKVTAAQERIAEVGILKTHIVNYAKTRDVYAGYRKAGYSKAYLAEHEADIIIHKAAKKAFDEMGVKKLPTVKSLQAEFAQLLSEKKEAYAELKKIRDELREVAIHKANYEELRNLEEREKQKEKEHGRG